MGVPFIVVIAVSHMHAMHLERQSNQQTGLCVSKDIFDKITLNRHSACVEERAQLCDCNSFCLPFLSGSAD